MTGYPGLPHGKERSQFVDIQLMRARTENSANGFVRQRFDRCQVVHMNNNISGYIDMSSLLRKKNRAKIH
jgi:hypothetical protein